MGNGDGRNPAESAGMDLIAGFPRGWILLRREPRIGPSHARMVVRECCKGDDESQWERGKFDPPPPKNPLTDGHQNLCR